MKRLIVGAALLLAGCNMMSDMTEGGSRVSLTQATNQDSEKARSDRGAEVFAKDQRERERKYDECYRKPACRKDMAIRILKSTYSNSKSLGNESLYRAACKSGAQAYRNGISKERLGGIVWSDTSMSPNTRGYVAEVTGFCWETESVGVSWHNVIGGECNSFNTSGCHPTR